MVLDVQTSVLAILTAGWLGGVIATALRLPRIVAMILLGIAISPSLHPAVMNAPIVVTGGIATPDAISPASSMRTMALLIALARGGLSLKISVFRELGLPIVLLATLPYIAELVTEGILAPMLLPAWYGINTPEGVEPSSLISFLSAAVWAPLSPSIVIPNMLAFVDLGLTHAGSLVLSGAPLEVSVALVTEGVMFGCLLERNGGSGSEATLGHIPTYTLGSMLYGAAFALLFYGYKVGRERTESLLGKPDATEPKLVFLLSFLLCYSTSIDNVVTPWLVGFFAALCMAAITQFLLPSFSDELVTQLKPVWYFAECFLFVLTGCVIRPAIDSGFSKDLFGSLLLLLLAGQLARLAADVLVAIAWEAAIRKSSPIRWSAAVWADVARRLAFIWVATMPKATLQASLGPKLPAPFAAAGAISASRFVAPAAAISILYGATAGSLLTFTLGKSIAVFFQEREELQSKYGILADSGSLGTVFVSADMEEEEGDGEGKPSDGQQQ